MAAAVHALCDAAYGTVTAPLFASLGSGEHLLGLREKGRWHRGNARRASHDSALTADTVTRLGLAPVSGVAAWRGVVGLQARQVAGVTVAGEMNERFGGEHTNLTSAPLRHDLVVLPPDALAVLAAMREQGGLFLFDH